MHNGALGGELALGIKMPDGEHIDLIV